MENNKKNFKQSYRKNQSFGVKTNCIFEFKIIKSTSMNMILSTSKI